MKYQRVTPGTKVYKLFEHERLICEGKKEVFIISVKKMPKEEFQKQQHSSLHHENLNLTR